MSIYTNNGDKISTAALFASLDYDQDAQQIERGAMYEDVYDILNYGRFEK